MYPQQPLSARLKGLYTLCCPLPYLLQYLPLQEVQMLISGLCTSLLICPMSGASGEDASFSPVFLFCLNCNLQPQCPFPFVSLGIAWECDLGFSDLFFTVTGAGLGVCCLHWQAVIGRNGNGLQQSSKGGNWFFAQAVISCWDDVGWPLLWGKCVGKGLPQALQQRSVAIWGSRDCSLWNLLWISTPVKRGKLFCLETDLSLGLLSDGDLDPARKYPIEWCVCWASPFGVERQTGGGFLAMVSELWLWLISYSFVSDHLDIGKALPAPSQWLDPCLWTPSHSQLVSGSSETLQTSWSLQSTNPFYWDLPLTGHCIKARAETGIACLFQTEVGARLWKEGQLMTGNLPEDGGRLSRGHNCAWMSWPVVQI